MNALLQYGPIPVALKVAKLFYNFARTSMQFQFWKRTPSKIAKFVFYRFAILQDSTCNNPSDPDDDHDHEVVIAGYDTDTDSGADYWIALDSPQFLRRRLGRQQLL